MLLTTRVLSLCLVFAGVICLALSITTDVWWQKASSVPSAAFIKYSIIYVWKGLQTACVKIPPATQALCKPLKDFGLEDDEVKAVRYLLYIAIGIGCIEILIVLACLLITRRLFLDCVSVSSIVVGVCAGIGLSIYTNSNPTIGSFFVFYGYSYIIGWLGVTCLLLSSLLALLSRMDEDGQTFLSGSGRFR